MSLLLLFGGGDGVAPTPPVEPTILPGGGRGGLDYLSWWERELRRILDARRKKKKLAPKKRELAEELEEKVDELALIASEEQSTQVYTREIRQQVLESAALLNQAYQAKVSNDRLKAEIASLEAYIRELDDEETIILAIH